MVFLIKDGARIPPGTPPTAGPFWDDPQPMFGIDVIGLKPGESAVVDDAATSFPARLSKLPEGTYTAQAILDVHRDDSSWKREPGNLFSRNVTFQVRADGGPERIWLALEGVVPERPMPSDDLVDIVTVRSEVLSSFHKRDVFVRAGVVRPIDFDANRRYPAIYEVPGFGGDVLGAFGEARHRRAAPPGSAEGQLARHCYWIVLDPESENGHTLLADSEVNGPCAQALIHELIPAIEAKHSLIASASARYLRGHSSGGWSTLWLAMQHPKVFGGCWSTSPDPVDFRRFQLVDLFGGQHSPNMPGSMYQTPSGAEVASYQDDGTSKMTIRQENMMEEVLGPRNSSGQQWDSWQAVFGPRRDDGGPEELFDPISGVIHPHVAILMSKFDIRANVERDPERFLQVFRDGVRLVVGDMDNFFLHEAVKLLDEAVQRRASGLPELGPRTEWTGYIKILPGLDHGSVLGSPVVEGFPKEMLDALGRAGHLPPAPEGAH